jgi:NTP pyrophosphatase (non-canonical NTP hydrolase)
MSISLLEAQKLSGKIFRQINEKLDVMRGKGWNPFIIVTDILEEAGEVASIVKGLEGYKPPEKPKTKEMLATELSDLLCSTEYSCLLSTKINLEKVFIPTIQDYYKRRFLK